jgi:hypothetical protein
MELLKGIGLFILGLVTIIIFYPIKIHEEDDPPHIKWANKSRKAMGMVAAIIAIILGIFLMLKELKLI